MKRACSSVANVLLLGGLLASCSRPPGMQTDAATPGDQGVAWDVASDLGGATDASVLDALDDAADVTADRGADAPSDVGVDARGPTGDAWAGVPLVDLGGYLIPIDPSAVPAPGSECHGDAGVRAGDPMIAPPRPIRPLSVSRVSSQRPSFQWVLPEGTTGARVEVCADRCCTRVLQTIDAEGTTVRPMTALPPGVVFWRMFGRRGTTVGSRASYTWEFEVRRRDAPNDTSGGTIRDFNGDGFDDLMTFRARPGSSRFSDLLLLPGSAEGLRPPVATGAVAQRDTTYAMVGDYNGDGLADIAWNDQSHSGLTIHSMIQIVAGSRGPMRSSRHPDLLGLGSCAVTAGGAAVDWNGDGYSDLFITVLLGCDFVRSPDASIVLGYSGSPTGIATSPQWGWRVDGYFPSRLVSLTHGAGDLDNDGHGDITIESINVGGFSETAEHAIMHGANADAEPRLERWPEPTTGMRSWLVGRVASVGDVDGDGYLDLLMSIEFGNPLIYRHSTGIARPSVELVDPLMGETFGFSYSSGDVNGDGVWDVTVSSDAASDMEIDRLPANAGRVYVFLGSPSGVVTNPITLSRAGSAMDRIVQQNFGNKVIVPGDVNGDGIDDVIMTDTLGWRLCVRLGRLVFESGSPDACLEGFMLAETWNF